MAAIVGIPTITNVNEEQKGERKLSTCNINFNTGFPADIIQQITDRRDEDTTADWCAFMDDIFLRQVQIVQENVDRLVQQVTRPFTRRDEVIRAVIKMELGYGFAEPDSDMDDMLAGQAEGITVQLDVFERKANGTIRYTLRDQNEKSSNILQLLFFDTWGYGGVQGEFVLKLQDNSRGNYKYIITKSTIICYVGRRAAAGCAKDVQHATTKIMKGRIVQGVVSPKNMCVIATLRHALGLTNPNPGIERKLCRSDHFEVFGHTVPTTSLLPLDTIILKRLGDHYNTDIAIVGEIDKLVSKSRDSVVTLHYEDGHVWLVIADDSGHCRVCNKQYTSVKWLTEHRRHCHRCSLCRRAHSSEVICGWCNVCQINHPTISPCNESRSEYYRDFGRNSTGEEAKQVIVKFNRANLMSIPKQRVLHFDIETAQYPSMKNQVAINIEWAIACMDTDVMPVGANVFFEDDPLLYTIGYDGKCHALYSTGVPTRDFTGKAWRMYSAYGRQSMTEFVSFLRESSVGYILNAFNGSRFDHIFLLREWQSQGLLVKDMAFQGCCPILGTLVVSKKVNHTIWDVCRHLCGSLATNAKAAGLSVSKDSFTDFHLLVSDASIEEHKDKLQEYCRKDVQVLALLYETTASEIYNKFGVHIVDYVTTSHMTYSMAFLGSPTSAAQLRLEKLAERKASPRTYELEYLLNKYIENHKESANRWEPITDVWVYRQPELEGVFRAALYGGRCYPTQTLWESSQLIAVREGALGYEEVDDYVLDLDANSLYPHAMSMPMPTGELHVWDKTSPIPPNLGIYYIKYIANKKLMNSPLPSREKDGGLAWTLEDGEGWYTTVDIDNAKRFGYLVDYIEGYFWECSTCCFQPYINYLYTAKDKMKQLKYTPGGGYSPALYNQLKLLLNGLWGKTSQRPVARDVQQVKKADDLIKFFEEHTKLQFAHFGENPEDMNYWVQGDIIDKAGKISKPVQIANFVLAWSRRIMLDVMDVVDPGLSTCSFLYTDTDSLFVKVTPSNKARLEALLGPKMGQLSNDLCDPKTGGKNGKVLRMVCPAPKAYSAEYILDNNTMDTSIHAKGIHTSFFKTHSGEIADALTAMVSARFDEGEKHRSTFSWGSDGMMEDDDCDKKKYTSKAPYMKKIGAMGGFEISHAHISRQLGKTQFSKRIFFSAEEMSYPIGYVSE